MHIRMCCVFDLSFFNTNETSIYKNLFLLYFLVREKVQRSASKIPIRLKDLPYEERLKIWGITPLEERRTRGYLILTHKL